MNALHAGDALGDDHAFMHRLVREPGRADEIADRPDAGDAGLAPFVDDDMGAVDLDAGGFEADILDIADDADGEDHAIDGERFGLAVLGLQRRGDVVGALLQLLDGGRRS